MKFKYYAVAISAIVLLVGWYLYLESNESEATQTFPTLEEVRAEIARRESEERLRVIELARNWAASDEVMSGKSFGKTNDLLVRGMLDLIGGPFIIQGWDATQESEGVYIVSFSIMKEDSSTTHWYWEVQTAIDYVRAVHNDTALTRRYGLTRRFHDREDSKR